ncbi:MAG: hypothetical protein E7040_02980 [Lentisphaerae bacterium]|nr:hypothetical protein [Lentisphaerota bacterium]
MRKSVVLSVLFCGLFLSTFCFANSDRENFVKTTKYIDAYGEMYQYSNTRGIEVFFNEKIPALIKIFTKESPEIDKEITPIVDAVRNSLNVGAFKAYASSSVDAGNGVYVAKSFILFDRKAQSIFIDPKASNKPLNWKSLPADTRLAFKVDVNLAHVWAILKKEFSKTSIYKEVAEFAENPEINAILNNFHGDVEFLLTGTSLDNWAFRAAIPDKNGRIGALIRKHAGNAVKNDTAEIPLDANVKIVVKLMKDQIVAYSSRKTVAQPQKTLASKPLYQSYAKYLPENGSGYIVMDIPQEVITLLKNLVEDPEISQIIDLFLKPVSIVSVSTVEKDGAFSVCAANISFAQISQVGPMVGVLSVGAGMLWPALESARIRGRLANCSANIKQLGTGIFQYMYDNDGYLPTDLKELVKKAYVAPAVLNTIIYVGPYEKTKASQIKNPSSYILAVCLDEGHKDRIAILFADGHVENLELNGEEPVKFLQNEFKLNAADVTRISKRLKEAKK